jgi:hypothetical protein
MTSKDAEVFLDFLEITPKAAQHGEYWYGVFFNLHPTQAKENRLHVCVETIMGNGNRPFLEGIVEELTVDDLSLIRP